MSNFKRKLYLSVRGSFVTSGRVKHQRRNTRLRMRFVAIVSFMILAVLQSLSPAIAQNAAASERKVKVAYLYNFVRYVRWPDSAFTHESDPFVIGILSDDPHGRLLDRVAAKKRALGRPIVVRRFKSVREIQNCHLVFIFAGSGSAIEAEAIARTGNQQTLLICDSVAVPQQGAPIRFFQDHDGTIGLQINVDAMGRRNLKADAKLLNIATVVRG